jgi:hypothetical protein
MGKPCPAAPRAVPLHMLLTLFPVTIHLYRFIDFADRVRIFLQTAARFPLAIVLFT